MVKGGNAMKKNCLLICFCMVFLAVGAALAREVPINPITQDVKEKIKESVKLVGKVDESVAPKVKELDKIFQMYASCKGKEEDKGCVQLKEQIGEKYAEVLKSIGDVLPKMKKTLTSTTRSLGRSIEAKTRRSDVKSLYENISKKSAIPKVRGPLSKKLSELLESLGGSSNMSILELSLQTQGDLIAASETLEFLESKVSQLALMVELGQELPILSEEMASVMKGVADLFGYDLEYIPDVDTSETGSEGGGYGWN